MLLTAAMLALCCPVLVSGTAADIRKTRLQCCAPTKAPLINASAENYVIFAQESAAEAPLLRMVVIRARSSIEVRQLRGMLLDIVCLRPDPDRPPGKELLSGGYIVKAVVSAGLLKKLKAKGFEIIEIQ
jgi:hypothetical protein